MHCRLVSRSKDGIQGFVGWYAWWATTGGRVRVGRWHVVDVDVEVEACLRYVEALFVPFQVSVASTTQYCVKRDGWKGQREANKGQSKAMTTALSEQ